MRYKIVIILFFALVGIVSSQTVLDPTHVGKQWLDESKTYFKVDIAEEGIYRVSYQELLDAGMPVDEINGTQIELYSFGRPMRIRVSNSGPLSEEDYVEWFGIPNDGTVDALLYNDPEEEQLNKDVSLYTDKRPYYLTWTTSPFTQQYFERRVNNNSNPTTEEYYLHSEKMVFDSFHYKPTHDGRNFIRYSSMDIGEGFGTAPAGARAIHIPVNDLYEFGTDPVLKLRFGTNVLSRSWSIVLNGKRRTGVTTGGYSVADINIRIPLEDIENGEAVLELLPLNNNNEKHTLASVELLYPRTYTFDSTEYITYQQQPSLVGRRITIPNYQGTSPIAYNITKGYYQYPAVSGEEVTMLIPQSAEIEQWVIVDQASATKSIPGMTKLIPNKTISSSDYLILSTTELIASGAVQLYADYRSSPAGGSHDVKITDVNDLYDLYGYGVKGHPIAIKNYIQDLRENEMLPSFIFLMGKGREYDDIRNEIVPNLLPTFGVPGSDNLLVAQRAQRYPDVAVGRLTAQTPDDITNYLSKIIDHEQRPSGAQTIEDQAWKKRIIHLSGGSADIQESIFGFLNSMGDVIENNTFGADVFTFRKRSADPLEAVSSSDIVSRIDEGASILTFFGHSAVGTFDFSLEDPSKYTNKGRNPIILSLGCHSGNIHTSSRGISEEFVLEPDNGAIAFIASAGTAYAEPQYLSGLYFYDLIGSEMYGMPIGQVLQSSLQKRGDSESLAVQTLIEQLTLHGDPAYYSQTFEGPDYLIDEATVGIQPSIISANTPYITIDFDLINIGTLQDDLLDVRVIHVMPDGSHGDTIFTTVSAPGYKTSLSIDIDNPGNDAIGANRVLIDVDPRGSITELPGQSAEENNGFIDPEGLEGISFIVFDNSAKPVYPANYGIVGGEGITLKASLSNGLISAGDYIMEIDTTAGFDSPLLIRETRTADKSIIEWQPATNWSNETVYYWRIAPKLETQTLKSSQWRTSSFVYLEQQQSGWNQSHYFQQANNQYTSLKLDESSRSLAFIERTWDVRIKNELRQDQDFWVFVNSTPWASLNAKNLAPGIAIFVWDPGSVIFNNNTGIDFGSLRFSKDVFIYKMDRLLDRRNVISLLDAIPEGARVFMHTILGDATSDLHVHEWESDSLQLGTTLYDVLEGYGAVKVRELIKRGTVPYTFVFDKGGAAVVEDIANNIEEVIDLSAQAKSNWDFGEVTSVDIGPAKRWSRLQWSETKNTEDQTSITVYGLTTQGEEIELRTVSDSYDLDISDISSTLYPSLRLKYKSRDEQFKTSANLNYWRILYDVLPDAAIYTTAESKVTADTVDAGAPLEINYDLLNLSPTLMSGVDVRYTLVDEQGRIVKSTEKRTDKLLGDRSQAISVDMSTDQLSGEHQLIIEVNPGMEIAEQTDCNNIGFKRVYIRPDRRNPYLDVTFDEEHIRNGDLVSRRPKIVITLEDPNSFLLLDDPDDFDITLTFPQVFVWQPDTSNRAAVWVPASDINDNKAQWTLSPNLDLEGIYTLEVNAKDKAGNPSGNRDYRVQFEVEKEPDPVVLSVGPNPSSDYVLFDYNISGDLLPQIFDLYIYAADGRLVAHAGKEDFGGLKIGLNTYRWDARNSGGEVLPSGVYFYEIINSFDSRKDKTKGSVFILRP